jgi:hypothetical protein
VPVRLRNRSFSLLTVELNSGDSVHLAPDETSAVLDDREVDENPWIAKLEGRQAVEVEPVADKPSRGRKGGRS